MKNKHGNTALHEAVLNRHVDVVRLLLSEDLEPVYWKNRAEKSPLYLALDAKDSAIHEVLFSLLLEPSRIEGLPPIHGVIVRNDYALSEKILKKDIKLFAMTDSEGGNVFHLAAFLNWPLVRYLLLPETEYLARERDMNGDLPIHIAAKMGHVELIEKLHLVSQLPNGQGQTVLHVAAKYGQASAVRHILRHPELGNQIYAVDHARNTPLHLAAMHSQPATLIPLLLDKRIQLDVPNNKCFTAVDVARECISKGYSIRKQLAFIVLVCSCTGKVPTVSGDLLIRRPEARDKESAVLVHRSCKKMLDRDIVKDSFNSRMVVATLVATVTFAAGLAVPGGFNGSDTVSKNDWGMATMMDKKMFQAFAICNTIAMFSSMITVVNLIWTRLSDVHGAIAAFEHSELPLRIALLTMFTAFLTGVTLTVGKLPWLANTIFYLGLLFLLIFLGARLLEKPPLFMIHRLPIRRLTFWIILANIYMWRVKTYLSIFIDEAEDDGTTSGTSAGQPADGARESKTDDSTTAKCGDAPRPPSH